MPQYPTDTADTRSDERRRLCANMERGPLRREIARGISWTPHHYHKGHRWFRYCKGGNAAAAVWPDTIYRSDGSRFLGYIGASLWLDRTLAEVSPGRCDPFSIMDAIVAGERLGAFADCWMDHDGPPQPPGWTHGVRQERDCWSCVTSDHVHLFVAQVPYGDRRGRVYVAAVDGGYLRDANAMPTPYGDPVAAMNAAEAEARRRGHVLGTQARLPFFI